MEKPFTVQIHVYNSLSFSVICRRQTKICYSFMLGVWTNIEAI